MKKARPIISFITFLAVFAVAVLKMPVTVSAQVGIVDGKTYYIQNIYTGHYLDAQGGSPDYNGQNVIGYSFHGGENQQWRAQLNPDDTITFVAVFSSSGRVLDVTGDNVDIYSPNYPNDQKFTLYRDYSLTYGGTYLIKLGDRYVTEIISSSDVCVTTSKSLASLWSFQAVDKGDVDFYPFYYEEGRVLGFPVYFDTTGPGSTIASEMGSLGYPTYTLTNCAAQNAYNYMKSDDVWVFDGHGLEDDGVPLATLVFVDGNANANGFISPHSNINFGSPCFYIESMLYNSLAQERCILYIGCSTGKSFRLNGADYNLVDSAFWRGAHFVLGTTRAITTAESEDWLTKFFEKAGDGGTIRECIDHANYYEDMGLLYYQGDVYAKFK